ncbi:hypothetical protein B0H14DRAFT_3151425 [Mycena olivaceomarginata]|nr:hypothetical protein B0H14DRAFT_3151425 [Mycena olivaceomarginata]
MSASPTFSFASTADDVATAFAAEIRGKNVLVTGTSLNGIGYETALAIAKHASLVTITGYNADRLKLTAEAINEGGASCKYSAAAAIGPFKLTIDSLESQFGTDHVGPFLLTKLLAPKLIAATTPSYTPRVVFVASAAHAFGTGIDFASLEHQDPTKYNPSLAYFQAKAPSTRTVSILVECWGQMDNPTVKNSSGRLLRKELPTTVVTAFDPRLNDKPGAYLKDGAVATESVAPHSSDPVVAEKLWAVTEKIIGEDFEFNSGVALL